MTQAARFVITGVRPDTWFGPFQPLAPMAPDQEGVKGRRFDYSTGYNLNYIPRSTAPIGFGELKALSHSCDLLRIAIESRKDQISALDWVIRPRQADTGEPSLWYKQGAKAHPEIPAEMKKRIDAITDFLRYPDRETSWDMWVKEWMENVYVIDSPAIWRRKDRGGRLYALEQLEGSMFKPLLGADGRRPKPPDPAYQQILHGVPAADFTTEELLYCPWNPRTDSPYGYSKVEQILITINTSIRRSIFQLNWYTEGSQPDAYMGLPKDWNLSQIKDFQDYMDSLLAGNLATRRRLRFVPGEFKYQEAKSPPLKDQFDEYLARVICFTFAIAPDPFIEHVSRGAVEKSHTRALEEGLEPNQRYIKAVVDRVIWEDFDSADLEFKYVENREQDPKDQMTIDIGYAKAGIYSIDEIRLDRGKAALGGPASIPMLATATGYIPLGALTNPNVEESLAAAGGPAAQALQHQRQTGGGGDSGSGNQPRQPETQQRQLPASRGATNSSTANTAKSLESEHDHSPANPLLNVGEEGGVEDAIERLLKAADSGGVLNADFPHEEPIGTGGYAPRANLQASQGGSGNYSPAPNRTNANDLPFPGGGVSTRAVRSEIPRQMPIPRGNPQGGGGAGVARSQRITDRGRSGPTPFGYTQSSPHSYAGLHRDPWGTMQQPRLDYYNELHRMFGKLLGTGEGEIDRDNELNVDLPQASGDVRAHVGHVAWKRVQSKDFKLTPKRIPIDKIVATQPHLDARRLQQHILQFDAEGDTGQDPPLLLFLSGDGGNLYYILDGHHRIEAAKHVGLEGIIADLLEGTDRDGKDESSSGSESSHVPDAGVLTGGPSHSPPAELNLTPDWQALDRELEGIASHG